ncbi:hypothetical protein VTN00DRAFT_1712 [Thermoascus crustaceus]|uniref:uncharacterized protein n=1 Tax=Thermoascus crustaceus TaxID=5088 RepID=UPI0037433041
MRSQELGLAQEPYTAVLACPKHHAASRVLSKVDPMPPRRAGDGESSTPPVHTEKEKRDKKFQAIECNKKKGNRRIQVRELAEHERETPIHRDE